jgi:hypothetical protein
MEFSDFSNPGFKISRKRSLFCTSTPHPANHTKRPNRQGQILIIFVMANYPEFPFQFRYQLATYLFASEKSKGVSFACSRLVIRHFT